MYKYRRTFLAKWMIIDIIELFTSITIITISIPLSNNICITSYICHVMYLNIRTSYTISINPLKVHSFILQRIVTSNTTNENSQHSILVELSLRITLQHFASTIFPVFTWTTVGTKQLYTVIKLSSTQSHIRTNTFSIIFPDFPTK